jgi:hypothetical protein
MKHKDTITDYILFAVVLAVIAGLFYYGIIITF